MEIDGLSGLDEQQTRHMLAVHKNHVACNGLERQKNMKIKKAWVDDDGCVCVLLENNEWYHYYSDGTWG